LLIITFGLGLCPGLLYLAISWLLFEPFQPYGIEEKKSLMIMGGHKGGPYILEDKWE
jgi:hypothetical protein